MWMLERYAFFSEVTRLPIVTELMARFGGTDNLGYDANSLKGVKVADT